MSVIAEIRIPSTQFELGRILSMGGRVSVELETLVPIGEKAVPFFWVFNADQSRFLESVESHDSVERITEIDVHEERILFGLDWHVGDDVVFSAISDNDGHVLEASGTADVWEFECRFETYDGFNGFKSTSRDAGVSVEITQIYNPTKPDAGPWYGLTLRQRETLLLAIAEGYYDIPRRITTLELAGRIGISDQAVTERLRRAIVALGTNALGDVDSDSPTNG